MNMKGNNILLSVVLVVLVLVAGFYFINQKGTDEGEDTIKEEQNDSKPAIEITKQEIKEANFTGSSVLISGTNPLALTARAHVEARVAEFKKSADEEVPAMRAQFGADIASSNYTLDITAKYLENVETDSVIIDEYAYTGGANGNSTYRVFTASHPDGKILSLGDVIKKEKQKEFIELVKKELIDWRPEAVDEPVVFVEVVQDLDFAYLTNWSMDENNLTLYFSKYEIGPGVLGSVAFPISLEKIKSMLY